MRARRAKPGANRDRLRWRRPFLGSNWGVPLSIVYLEFSNVPHSTELDLDSLELCLREGLASSDGVDPREALGCSPDATDAEVVANGRRAILWCMTIGILLGFVFMYIKLANPEFPLDPFFKKTSYFIKNGFVVLIAALLVGIYITAPAISVMIPGVNDEHLKEVNRVVKAKGAFLHNIMPLIADAKHGDYFGVTGQRSPTAAELQALQDSCGGDMRMMRHCRQCRSDAVGLLGEDRSAEFKLNKIEKKEIDHQAAADMRAKSQAAIREKLQARSANNAGNTLVQLAPLQRRAITPKTRPVLMAVATKGGGLVNQHFGHAREFLIYEIGRAHV